MRVLVVYDSVFGNTAQIAAAVTRGILDADPRSTVSSLCAGSTLPSEAFDVLIAGGPTHFLGMSSGRTRGLRRHIAPDGAGRQRTRWPRPEGRGMREWLSGLPTTAGPVAAAAFDTRLDTPLSGGAAPRIAGLLRAKGYRVVVAPAAFQVTSLTGPLRAGEVARARAWGAGVLREAVRDRTEWQRGGLAPR